MAFDRSNGGGKVQVRKSVDKQSVFASFARKFSLLCGLLKLAFRSFSNNDHLFILLPWPMPFKGLFYRIVLLKKANLNVIMVDLECIRRQNYDEKFEKQICLKAKSILCQTERMKKAMEERGYIAEGCNVITGNFWPILTELPTVGESSFGYSIAFSGNLGKAPFASKLSQMDSRLQFTVNPAFRMITEDWGLVWDGDSLETCTGLFGNYMKMVFPYKASLYLASNRPLIVWEESGIAEFVKEQHLGITVKSLYDIHDKIVALTDEEKDIMRTSVAEWCRKVRTGSERLEQMQQMIETTKSNDKKNYLH